MTAKKYDFTPSQVHVKVGTTVQLRITALDREHGFQMATVPEGAESSPQSGLLFTSPQRHDAWRLNKEQETTVEFVAKVPGTYDFKCSVVCGFGHGRMKGQLVVDP